MSEENILDDWSKVNPTTTIEDMTTNTNMQWATSSSSELCEVHHHETISTVSMDEVLREDPIQNQQNTNNNIAIPLQVAIPIQVVNTDKLRKCTHHHHSPTYDRYDEQRNTDLDDDLIIPEHLPENTQNLIHSEIQSTSIPNNAQSTQNIEYEECKPKKSKANKSKSNKTTKFKNELNLPIIHTPTTTFPCPDCGKKFLWHSRLIVHRRSHTGEKPFPCTQCGAAFAQRWILTVHMKTHNPPENQQINHETN